MLGAVLESHDEMANARFEGTNHHDFEIKCEHCGRLATSTSLNQHFLVLIHGIGDDHA